MSKYETPGENGTSRPGINQIEHPENSHNHETLQVLDADPEEQFKEAIETSGLCTPTTGFVADGQSHAFDGEAIGEENWTYWFDGQTGGWQAPDRRYWEWPGGWNKARLAWLEPQDLQVDISALDYPVGALPPIILAAVKEVQDYTMAPLALVAGSALSAISIAGQAHVDVRRDAKLQGPSSLFLLTIANSGERKSTSDSYFSKTIRDYEAEQAEIKKPELQDHEARLAVWKARHTGIKDRIRQLAKKGLTTNEANEDLRNLEHEKPLAPRVPRLLYSDTTSEELAHRLATGWPSGAITSPEAGLIFGGHGMNSESLMRTLGLYNVLWDGGTIQIDRRTSQSFILENTRLTVGLQIQEAALQGFLGRGGELARGIGFFARCLIAWPKSTQGTRFFKPAPDSWPALTAFNQRMREILNTPAPTNEKGGLCPCVLKLSKEAKTAWTNFYNHIEGQQGRSGKLFDASKTADNAARLAALFHLFELGPYGEISLEQMEGATRIAAWHLNEAKRFFGGLTLSDENRQLVELSAWLVGNCQKNNGQGFSTRDVQRGGPNRSRQKDVLLPLLTKLEELAHIRLTKTGRSTMLIEINPALLAKGNNHA
ncbi:MAG: DUF3987 domain-containing protein [Hyphomicrobiaceae bacterium]|nr:DUF3987 domain-containing protein [Hyphomicrobiaceae bacterium]